MNRLPDGTKFKFKSRYFVQGDKQIEGVDYFVTCTPVFQWSKNGLVITMLLANGWTTQQVDYTNAIKQTDLKQEIYIESPKVFLRNNTKDLVFRQSIWFKTRS